MQRYNLFKPIHKGLRALLYDTALFLQQTEFSERKEASNAIERLSLVLALFETHAYYQKNYILPAVEKFNRKLANEFKHAAIEEHTLEDKIRKLILIFKSTSSEQEQRIAGSAIVKAYMDFLIFSLNHMAQEEIRLNQTLWRHYSNSEILGIEEEMIDNVPSAKMAVYGKWMIKGMSDKELIRWFGKIRDVAPDYLYNSLLTLTEIELPSDRWYKIEEAIADGVQAA